jgi:hypothetical protein
MGSLHNLKWLFSFWSVALMVYAPPPNVSLMVAYLGMAVIISWPHVLKAYHSHPTEKTVYLA